MLFSSSLVQQSIKGSQCDIEIAKPAEFLYPIHFSRTACWTFYRESPVHQPEQYNLYQHPSQWQSTGLYAQSTVVNAIDS